MEQQKRTNPKPESTGAIPPAEIRTTHFPTACALLAHGEIMTACTNYGRMAEFVFQPTPKALRIVEAARTEGLDVPVPLKRFMECYDLMRDACKSRRPWPVGIQLFPSSDRQ